MKLMIGLDMGEKCGFAAKEYERGVEKLVYLVTLNFWDCAAMIAHIFEQNTEDHKYETILVVIEDVSQNRAVFDIEGAYKRTKGDHINKIRVIAKMGQNVGSVKEKTKLIINFCEDNEYPTHLVVPHRGGTTKVNAEYFKKITGWQEQTNEHERDAAMMIWGLNK